METRTMNGSIDVLVSGSRDWPFPGIIESSLNTYREYRPLSSVTVIHGDAPHGADAIADAHARRMRWQVETYPAQWKMGRHAGHVRNVAMLNRILTSRNDPMCMCFCLDFSRGTMDMLRLIKDAEMPYMLFSAESWNPGRIRWENEQGTTVILTSDYPQQFAEFVE